MASQSGRILQVFLLVSGCQRNSAVQPRVEQLCDGSASLRLHVFAASSSEGEVRGSVVRVHHGHQAFAVDGKCNYWVNAGWFEDALSRDREWRSGTLQPADVQKIEGALPLANLRLLEDCAPEPGVADILKRSFSGKESGANCVGTGSRFMAAWTSIGALFPQLWARGLPVEGALRLSAVPTDPQGHPPYQWPLDEAVAGFVVDERPVADAASSHGGDSFLVSGAESTRKLRDLRARYLSDRGGGMGGFTNWDGLMVLDRGEAAFIYMRDVLPYENAQGRWAF